MNRLSAKNNNKTAAVNQRAAIYTFIKTGEIYAGNYSGCGNGKAA